MPYTTPTPSSLTSGPWIPSGRSERMVSILRRSRSHTAWSSSGGTSCLSSTDTTDSPVRDSLATVFSSGNSCATSSTLLVIRASTRSGPAPGKLVTTEATRIVYGGILSRGIV